jgi:hypothetical protein
MSVARAAVVVGSLVPGAVGACTYDVPDIAQPSPDSQVDAHLDATLDVPVRDAATDSGTTFTMDSTPAVDTGGAPTDSATEAPPSDGNPAMGFVGVYSCTLPYMIHVSSPVSTTLSSSASVQVTFSETGTVLSAVLVGDGGLSCTITFKDNGNGTATLAPADTQFCDGTFATPIGSVSAQLLFYMGGNADLEPAGFSTSNLPIKVSDGPGSTLGIVGTGTLSAACTKM